MWSVMNFMMIWSYFYTLDMPQNWSYMPPSHRGDQFSFGVFRMIYVKRVEVGQIVITSTATFPR